jgi:hypothetical protein
MFSSLLKESERREEGKGEAKQKEIKERRTMDGRKKETKGRMGGWKKIRNWMDEQMEENTKQDG